MRLDLEGALKAWLAKSTPGGRTTPKKPTSGEKGSGMVVDEDHKGETGNAGMTPGNEVLGTIDEEDSGTEPSHKEPGYRNAHWLRGP